MEHSTSMDGNGSEAAVTGPEEPSPDAPDQGDASVSDPALTDDGLRNDSGAAEQQQTVAQQHQPQQQAEDGVAGKGASAVVDAETATAGSPGEAPAKPKPPAAQDAGAKGAAQSIAAAAATPSDGAAAEQHKGDGAVDSGAGIGDAAATAGEARSPVADAEPKPKPPAAKSAAAKAAAQSKAAAASSDSVVAEQQAPPDAEVATAPQHTAADESPTAAAAASKPVAKKPAAKAPAKPSAPPAATAPEHTADAAEASSSPTAAVAAAPAVASKPAVAKKPAVVKKKPAQVSVAGGSGGAAANSAGSPVAAPSTHGSNPARKGLHTLFGETSTLSVLSQEGSELPGSRPPAQLHGALDGHDHGQIGEALMDVEEQQEIQKIISEIHGNGDDSDGDESQDDRLADIKHQHLMPQAAAQQHLPDSHGSSASGGIVPSSLTMPQQQTADDLLVYEQSGLSPGAAAASPAPATEASSTTVPAEGDLYSPQQAQQPRGRASPSPWPGVTQIQQELLDQDSSVEPTPAAHNAEKLLAQHSGPPGHQLPVAEPSGYDPSGYDPRSYADAAGPENEGSRDLGPEGSDQALTEGSNLDQGLGEGYGGYEGGGGGDDEERSRAIAEQLAQLHEESRRLNIQSQLLQHRAIEMSLQMASASSISGNSNAAAEPHSSSHQPVHHIANSGAHLNTQQQQEQQSMSYNPAAGSSKSSSEALGFSQAVTPDGVPLNPDSLGLVEGVVPRHPPGDSTPSSVTSSRAGLNWNIPSRGGVISPGKAGGMSPVVPGSPYLRSADAPRSNFNTIAQGFALHADPSLDYQMYTYHNDSNSSREAPTSNSTAAVDDSYQPPPPRQQQQRQQQPPMQEQYDYYQQQREPVHEQYGYQQQQQQHRMASPQHQHQQQQHQQEQQHRSDMQQQHDASHGRYMGHLAAETAEGDPPSPTAAAAGHGSRAFKAQRSLRGSKPGRTQQQKPAEPPLVVRKPTLPVKQGSGASTRVAAAGATAGRRVSGDNITSYYGLEETPVVGTFNAAHAVVGAQGTVVKAKQQQQPLPGAKMSPRTSMTSPTAAAAPAAAAGGSKAAGTAATTSAAAAAAAAAATSKLSGSSHKPAAVGRSRSGEVSPGHAPTAAALAAAAAAATSGSGGYQQQQPRMHAHPAPPPPAAAAAGPCGPMPVNPYAAAAAAAMYGGGYAAVNPGLVPMMMRNQMQATGNANSSNKGAASKISPGRGTGGNNMSHAESLTAMTAGMPPGAAWLPVGLPPGFMPVMPPGHMSAPGGKGGLAAPGHMGPGGVHNPNKTAAGPGDPGAKARRGVGGSASAPSSVQYGLPGMAPAQYMPMPGMPAMGPMGYPPMGFAPNPYAMNPQQAAMAAAAAGGAGRGGAAGKFTAVGHSTAQQGGGGRAGKGSVPAGVPAGYMPAAPGGYGMPAAAAAGYPAAGAPWGPMMGPPGQFGMMPMYAAAPGVMAGYQQQQQSGKGGKGGAGGKGGWQS